MDRREGGEREDHRSCDDRGVKNLQPREKVRMKTDEFFREIYVNETSEKGLEVTFIVSTSKCDASERTEGKEGVADRPRLHLSQIPPPTVQMRSPIERQRSERTKRGEEREGRGMRRNVEMSAKGEDGSSPLRRDNGVDLKPINRKVPISNEEWRGEEDRFLRR